MSKDFKETPSFYNNEEVFKKYLGNTSYYIGLQQTVLKLISLAVPDSVLELGAATGSTSIMIANEFPEVQVTGVDMRHEVVDIANAAAAEIPNVSFTTADMMDISRQPIAADFVVLLYSFHHILDPLDRKVEFLQNMYMSMKSKTFICIAETFLPKVSDVASISALWAERKDEGYYSTFWSALSGLDTESLEQAKAVGTYCRRNETLAGKLVAARDNEYLVTRQWLGDTAQQVGFEVLINEGINTIGDGVVLLYKH